MHSSYALDVSDFSVERDGKAQPLSELWPGGYQPGDRLGVVVAQPMDPVGCSNLICATITLFYDHMRKTLGTGNFFRYCDTYLFGVGCEAGDFNQLDIWPLHKWVTILNPTTEALLEAINDRKVNLLAIPESGARCRGEVVLSTWNAYLAHVKSVVTYSPRTGVARDADVSLVGNKIVESYVEQAIFSTPGLDAGYQARLRRLRRNIDREEKVPVESYRTLPNPAAARALLGVTQVLPPGHQELTRRATPTTIMPVEVPMPVQEGESAPFDTAAAVGLQVEVPAPSRTVCCAPHSTRSSAAWAARSQSGRAGTGSPTSATRSRSTTRCARRSGSGTSRRCASGSSPARGLSRRRTTASPATWPGCRSARPATRRSWTSREGCSVTASSSEARTTTA
jgi:hypothetical protein